MVGRLRRGAAACRLLRVCIMSVDTTWLGPNWEPASESPYDVVETRETVEITLDLRCFALERASLVLRDGILVVTLPKKS